MLGRRHVLPSVISSLTELMVEGTFSTGTFLITVHQPISSDDGDLQKALYSSFLPVPPNESFQLPGSEEYDLKNTPGAIITLEGEDIRLREGRKRMKIKVTSKGDRPIQVVGDHQVNSQLLKDNIDWLSLSYNRGKPSTGFRPPESLRVFPGHSGRHVRPIRTWGLKNCYMCRNRRPQNH